MYDRTPRSCLAISWLASESKPASASTFLIPRPTLHPDGTAPGSAVAEQLLGCAVAQAHLLADGQAGEQLRERVVVTAEFAGTLGEDLLRQVIGGQHHPPW